MAISSNNPPLLEVKNLRVEFPTRRGTLLAVDDVSFDIAPGEVLGVVGESGAGKSLTGNAIIGLLEPPGRIAGGEVKLEGRRIARIALTGQGRDGPVVGHQPEMAAKLRLRAPLALGAIRAPQHPADRRRQRTRQARPFRQQQGDGRHQPR